MGCKSPCYNLVIFICRSVYSCWFYWLLDEQMIAAEAPVLFSKACEMFILELTLRSWIHTEENKRRTLQRNDIAGAITRGDIFDFLVDIVPRDELKVTFGSSLILRFNFFLCISMICLLCSQYSLVENKLWDRRCKNVKWGQFLVEYDGHSCHGLS